jgi:hypothetical protein
MFYKLIHDILLDRTSGVFKEDSNMCIPFAPDNTDYQTFKKDLANGVALNDAEGTAMTADQIKTFLATLP